MSDIWLRIAFLGLAIAHRLHSRYRVPRGACWTLAEEILASCRRSKLWYIHVAFSSGRFRKRGGAGGIVPPFPQTPGPLQAWMFLLQPLFFFF